MAHTYDIDKMMNSYTATPEHEQARAELEVISEKLNTGDFASHCGDGTTLGSLNSTLLCPLFHALRENGVDFDDHAVEDFKTMLVRSCNPQKGMSALLRVRFKGELFCLPIIFNVVPGSDHLCRAQIDVPAMDMDKETAIDLFDLFFGRIDSITHDDPKVIRITYENLMWAAQNADRAMVLYGTSDDGPIMQMRAGTDILDSRCLAKWQIIDDDNSASYRRIA